MVRDRLAEMQAKNADESANPSAKKKETNGTPLLSSEQRLTDCLSVVTQKDNRIKKMKDDVEEMSKTQKNILANPMIDKSEVKKIDQIADRVMNTSSQLQKEISSYRQEVKDMHLDDSHERVILTHLDRLNSDITRTMNDFRAAQVEYIQKSQKIHNKNIEIVGGEVGEGESCVVDPSNVQAVFGADFLMEAQKARNELREVEQRHAEIKKIENSVSEVNRLFKEINMLIMEQGETIDTVERYVEEAVSKVGSGNTQLEQAKKYRDKARKKKICCCGFIFAIVTIIVVIVIIVYVGGGSDS